MFTSELCKYIYINKFYLLVTINLIPKGSTPIFLAWIFPEVTYWKSTLTNSDVLNCKSNFSQIKTQNGQIKKIFAKLKIMLIYELWKL